MAWAIAYAGRNRAAMQARAAALVEEVLGVGAEEGFACDHNHVRRERHLSEELWVHRKGAISAGEGEPGIIPGSMGAPSFHVEGRGCDEALGSSSHGAGRALSRAEARARIPPRRLLGELDGVYFDRRLAARLVDEAPSAYKDIGAVMRAQRALTRVVRRLRPVLAFKAA
jgi:tRNA-splicing ligase RtcB